MSDIPSLAADLDLRLVRYFTVVADHRHFGRAAQALHITQPSLSRQVRRLEQQLGARLLDRTPRGTALTEPGEVFLPRARALLRSADQAVAATHAAARPSLVTIGYTAGLVTTAEMRELRRRHPDTDVHAAVVEWNEVRAALVDHRVDVVVARLPFPTEQLHVTVLYDEPRALLIPVTHRLAGKESVSLDDIADEPVPRVSDPVWNAFWRIDPRPDGTAAPDGPVVASLEDKLELIASGKAVAVVPAAGSADLRVDLTTVPLEGVEPSRVALAIRADNHNRQTISLCASIQALFTGGGSQ